MNQNQWFAKTFDAGTKTKTADGPSECECECCGAVTHASERLEVNFYESKLICIACGTITKRIPRDAAT